MPKGNRELNRYAQNISQQNLCFLKESVGMVQSTLKSAMKHSSVLFTITQFVLGLAARYTGQKQGMYKVVSHRGISVS